MNKFVSLLAVMSMASSVLAEEVSDISESDLAERVFSDAVLISDLVRGARCAGIGVFLNEPSPSAPFVDISIQEWLTPPLATNVVRVHELDKSSTNWVFPTNVPVAFFAMTKRQMYANHPAFLIPDQYPPKYCYSITNETELAKFMFSEVDRSWFRVTRDNGLIYTFATNLWNCMRTNPNPTNYYEVLRDAERTVSMQDSWRVNIDASKGLSWLCGSGATESYLAEKLNDPLLSAAKKNTIGNTLAHRFGWTYSYTNNVNVWTPPQ